jgi:DNA-directed RNA polymerase subunit M/transcription elongation factor TFIIS
MLKISNPSLFRSNVTSELSTLLSIDDAKTAVNIERGIFNYALKEANLRDVVKLWDNPLFVLLYKDRLRSVRHNLRENPELCQSMQSQDISPQQFAFMTHQEWKPQHWKASIDRKMQRDASRYTDNLQASTDMYTCKKCRSKKCTYYEMQTRSADEPATVFVTCLDCGKRWRA